MDILFYISLFFISILLYIIYNLYKNLVIVENEIQLILKDKETFYLFITSLLIKCYTELNQVDKNGAFSSDDEVGFSFGVIKTAIQHTTEELKKLKDA